MIFRYLRPDAPVSLFFRLFTQVHLLIDGRGSIRYTFIFLYISVVTYSFYIVTVGIISVNNLVNFLLKFVAWILIQFCKFVFVVKDILQFSIVIGFIKHDINISFITFFMMMPGYLCNC